MKSEGKSPVVYILITLGVAIPVTAIIEGIVILIIFNISKRKKKNNVLQKYQPPQRYELKNNDYQDKLNGEHKKAVKT